MESTAGNFVLDLQCALSPRNCCIFLKLCKIRFYDLCIFYSVEKGFIAQTGDPSTGGTGCTTLEAILAERNIRINEGAVLPANDDEFHPKLTHRRKGTVGMCKTTRTSSNDTRFYITLAENLDYLDDKYTVIGHLAEGLEVLERINSTIVEPTTHRPYEDIVIKAIHVLVDPFPDFFDISAISADPSVPSIDYCKKLRIGLMQEIEEEKSLSPVELKRRADERDARSRALTLEILGDIPFYDLAPPENVLFVCRLNPLTQDRDLKTIFSRFGVVLNCEIVREKGTRRSLCYAFVEFDQKESCEEAYLKMEGVLIDDRRIHVDFSQSLAKKGNCFFAGVYFSGVKLSAIDSRSFEDRSESQLQLKRKYRDQSGEKYAAFAFFAYI